MNVPQYVDYHIYRGGDLPPVSALMYEYWLAGNGLFIRGKRAGIEALIQVSGHLARGLTYLNSYYHLDHPLIPREALVMVLQVSQLVCNTKLQEALFHFRWDVEDGTWRMDIPPQEASRAHVKPLETDTGSSYAQAFIDLHSHHEMGAFFSSTDDREEQGFRLYAVIGNIFRRPAIRLRIGLYGSFMEIPASAVFQLPDTWIDVNAPRNTEPLTPALVELADDLEVL